MREKVKAAAAELGLDVEIKTLDRPTRTVAEAATALGVEAGQIAKSLVFLADGEPVVIVASGAHRVDIDQLAKDFRASLLELAEAAGVELTVSEEARTRGRNGHRPGRQVGAPEAVPAPDSP